METLRGTTIVAVRRNGKVAMGGDSQATAGNMIVKNSIVKVRKIYNGKVVVGVAGNIVDAFTLFGIIENNLQKYSGNLERAVVEVARQWQNIDNHMRNLDAELLVANNDKLYIVTGNGDVMQPDGEVMSIGSGSVFALGAARALIENTELSARDIVEKSLRIAGQYCIYTNDHLTIEEVE